MVEQQIRTWEVLDQDVLDLLYVVRREEFVPAEYRAFAFSDMEIPLYEGADEGERMMQPKVEARILQELAVRKNERVLEVGTGSGYLTALLAARAHHVYSVEINPKLKAFGEENLRRNGVENGTVELGDAAQGWRAHAPYDVIVLTGSTQLEMIGDYVYQPTRVLQSVADLTEEVKTEKISDRLNSPIFASSHGGKFGNRHQTDIFAFHKPHPRPAMTK